MQPVSPSEEDDVPHCSSEANHVPPAYFFAKFAPLAFSGNSPGVNRGQRWTHDCVLATGTGVFNLGHFLMRFFRRNQALLAEGVETW